MPALSIIVPVYNKEKYIDSCIQSILNQTFGDFELILIDDGSTDGSGEKCDYYKNIDQRVLVHHQKNMGVSAARNTGISLSRGTFIGFVDSDDLLEPDMYELLIKNAIQFEADISLCGTRKTIYEVKENSKSGNNHVTVYNKTEALSAFFNEKLGMGVYNKIYQADLAKNITFEGSMFEDVFYIFKVLLNTNKVVANEQRKYINLVRDNSVSVSKFSTKYLQVTNTTQRMVNIAREKTPEVLDAAQKLDFIMSISQLNLLLLSNRKNFSEEYKQTVLHLNSYASFVKNNNNIKTKHRIAYKLFRASPELYAFIMELYCILTGRTIIRRTEGNSTLRKLLTLKS